MNKCTVNIKPLSVNKVWQGRRFKTQDYKNYEKEVLLLLPDELDIPEEGKLIIYMEFGVSSKMADWDNPIKPFQDILQKKYDFNDNRVYEAHIYKTIVEKGSEYIKLKIEPCGDQMT